MRLCILGSASSWYTQDLQRAGGDKHEIKCHPFSQIQAKILNNESGVSISACSLDSLDAILVRTMAPGSLEQVVFRMDALHEVQKNGVFVLNPPKSLETSIDKYLALAILRRAGFRIPDTIVCQDIDSAMDGFAKLDHDVVVKPLFGGEGRGITRVTDEAIALRVFKSLLQIHAVVYLQRFIQHDGSDLRLLVIGDHVLAMRRRNSQDWRTNIALGAVGETVQINDAQYEIAMRISDVIGAPFLGVDLLPGCDGQEFVIEVNAVPGWRMLAKTLGIDVSSLVLEYLASRISS